MKISISPLIKLALPEKISNSAPCALNANGNRLTRTVAGVTENYSYDDQSAAEIQPKGNEPANRDADKLLDVKVGGVTQKSYGYDSAGRTTSVVSGAGTTTLAYDYESRISTITYPSTATNTFTYNGLDTRVGKVDSAGTSTYKRDGAGVTAPVLSDASAVYTPGISERRSSTTTFLHSGLKNADSQTGTSQTIGATKQYDAFGNVLSSTGTWKGPFGYAGSFGYQEDADSSLKLLGHRYYDASTGRFLTRDPIKDGRNWYVYCDGNPLARVDGTGLQWSLGVGITAALVLGFDIEAGFVGNDDGTVQFKFSAKLVAGVALQGDIGAEVEIPADGSTRNQNPPGWKTTGPFDATKLFVGPVALVFAEIGGPINFEISPGVGAGMTTSLAGVEYHSEPLPVTGSSGKGRQDPRWPTPEDWQRILMPPVLLLK